jgi:hypothetical protein
MPANDHDLLVRIDEGLQTVQRDVTEIKDVVQADHDALLVLTGRHETDVEKLKGQIKATRIWQGVATVIGTAIGSIFGFHKA